MSVTQGTLEQCRELLKFDRLNRQQIETLTRNASIIGPLPDPSGIEGGEPYWTKQAFLQWSESAKRSRSGNLGMATRSLLGSLLGREQQREAEQAKSVGELAEAIAFDRIDIDAAESQCLALGATVADLQDIVAAIQERQHLIEDRDKAIDARSEIERLSAEIALIEQEIQEFKSPRVAKAHKLQDEQQAYQRVANQRAFAEQKLRQTIPDWLREELKRVQEEINNKSQRPKYMSNRIASLAASIDSTLSEIDSVKDQLRHLRSPRASDFEGQQRKLFLEEKQAGLYTKLEGSRTAMKQAEKDLKAVGDTTKDLRSRLDRLEALQLEVWPTPNDI